MIEVSYFKIFWKCVSFLSVNEKKLINLFKLYSRFVFVNFFTNLSKKNVKFGDYLNSLDQLILDLIILIPDCNEDSSKNVEK